MKQVDDKKEIEKIIQSIHRIESYLIHSSTSKELVYFDMFCENNVLKEYIRLLELNIKEISLTILNSVSLLIQNISDKTLLYYFYSSNIVNSIVNSSFQDEEYITYQINFIKSLTLKLSNETLFFFYNKDTNKFPIISKTLTFYNMNDPMIRNVVRNIMLSVLKIDCDTVKDYLSSFPINVYYVNLIFRIKETIINIGEFSVNNENCAKFRQKHDDLIEMVEYIQDIFNLKIESINYILINGIMNEIIIPICHIIISKKAEKISLIFSLYLIMLFIHLIKNETLYKMITLAVFDDFLPGKIMNLIKQTEFDNIKQEIIDNLDYLIKYNESADHNSTKWKSIKEYITDTTGVNLEDLSHKEDCIIDKFEKFIAERSDDINYSGYLKNDIVETFKLFLHTKDDLFLLVINLMINIIFTKNNKNGLLLNNPNCSLFNIVCKNKKKVLFDSMFDSKLTNENGIGGESKDSLVLLDSLLSMISAEQKLLNITTKIALENLLYIAKIFHESPDILYKAKLVKSSKQKISDTFFTIISYLKKDLDINQINSTPSNRNIQKYSFDLFTTAYEEFSFDITKQIKEFITLPWVLIPRIFIESVSSIPKYMKSNKSNVDFFISNCVVFLYLHDVLDMLNNKGINKIKSFPLMIDNFDYEIGKEYLYSSLPNECENCYLVTSKHKMKCVLVLLSNQIMIGEIIGNDFEKFEKIKVLYKIAFRHLIMKINSEESTREIILGNDNWSFDQFLRLDFFKKQNTNNIYEILDEHRTIGITLEISLLDSFIEDSITCAIEK